MAQNQQLGNLGQLITANVTGNTVTIVKQRKNYGKHILLEFPTT